MATPEVRVAFLMADYGHDPTETAVPFQAFKQAGFTITILTETGAVPACDKLMLRGWTQKLLGADASAVAAYDAMVASAEWAEPRAWAGVESLADAFDLVFLPGGHDKGVRQLLDSARAQALLAAYFPATKRAGGPDAKVCAAVCHGVQALAHAKGPDGASVLRGATTTALPAAFEAAAFHGTRVLLGDYYKTYGAGSPSVEKVVRGCLADPERQWRGSANPAKPLVVVDETYYYLSGRWPGDAELLAQKTIELVKQIRAG